MKEDDDDDDEAEDDAGRRTLDRVDESVDDDEDAFVRLGMEAGEADGAVVLVDRAAVADADVCAPL